MIVRRLTFDLLKNMAPGLTLGFFVCSLPCCFGTFFSLRAMGSSKPPTNLRRSISPPMHFAQVHLFRSHSPFTALTLMYSCPQFAPLLLKPVSAEFRTGKPPVSFDRSTEPRDRKLFGALAVIGRSIPSRYSLRLFR